MIRDALNNFPQQFGYEPKIENESALKRLDKFIVCGMGGSHLAADLLKIWKPDVDVIIHKDYGLPPLTNEDLESRLLILSSYSGNTEEVIDSFERGKSRGLAMAIIAVGGKLLTLAKEENIPYIQLPDTGVQPRMALGFSFRALLKLIAAESALRETDNLKNLPAADLEIRGEALAARLKGMIPVIYSSQQNYGIAYNWKIKFNETGKIPAFCNVFPELNHNEMNGFDAMEGTRELSQKFHFIFLRDREDDPRIGKRMAVLERLYRDRGFEVDVFDLDGETVFRKIFASLLLADWAAMYIAETYSVEAEQVPMVEEFKKLITSEAGPKIFKEKGIEAPTSS